MSALVSEVRNQAGELIGYAARCPACSADPDAGSAHVFHSKMATGTPGWAFNGNMERPTFSPSMLARWTNGLTGREVVCHSFLRDGKWEYLSDCTHAMAGQTVDVPAPWCDDKEEGCR